MPQFEALRSERETAQMSLDRLNALSMALRRSARLDAEVEVFDIHQVMNDSLLITGHRLRTQTGRDVVPCVFSWGTRHILARSLPIY